LRVGWFLALAWSDTDRAFRAGVFGRRPRDAHVVALAWGAEGDVWTHACMVCAQVERLEEWPALNRTEQLILLLELQLQQITARSDHSHMSMELSVELVTQVKLVHGLQLIHAEIHQLQHGRLTGESIN